MIYICTSLVGDTVSINIINLFWRASLIMGKEKASTRATHLHVCII